MSIPYLLPIMLILAMGTSIGCHEQTEPNTASSANVPAENHFELLPPERSGLNFVPAIQEDFRYNFSMDPYIYNGGGVAVIDVNNDGLQDLFFTARLQQSRLYLNKGNLHFEDASEKAGLLQYIGLKTGVTVVDINADGWQDLYVCRTWLQPIPERRNLLFVNKGMAPDGAWAGFEEKAAAFGIDDLSASQQGNFFDYDLDGDLDLYVMNHPVDFKSITNTDFQPTPNCTQARCQPPRDEYESDRLYRNDGNGHFSDVSKQAGIWNRAFGLSVHCADFNLDGYPDVLVGNDFIMPDFLYINNKNGGFTDQADQWFGHTSNHSMGADLADLNNDGLQDLVVLDMLAADWPRRRTLMSTMIPAQYNNLVRKGYGHQTMRNTLQINQGNGRFSEIGCLAGMEATDWSWAPLLADFDNDGFRDLFVANGIKRDLNDADFFLYTADSINRTGGISPQRFGSFEQFAGLIPSHPVHNYLFQNKGDFPLHDVSEAWGFTNKTFSNGAAYADLDNDGDLDLITNNLGAAPSLYENKAVGFNQHHWLQVKCKGSSQNPTGIGARLRVYAGGALAFEQEMTPVRGYYSSVEAIWQVGLGKNTQAERVEIQWPHQKMQVLTNVPANQRIILDITQAQPGRLPLAQASSPWVSPGPNIAFRHQENEFDDFNRERLLQQRYSTQGPCLAVGDVNKDGLEDLFIGGASGQSGAVFLQKNGQWVASAQTAFLADMAAEDTGACFLDADQDGDLDLYVVSGGSEFSAGDALYQDRLYRNDGKGNFSKDPGALPAESSSGHVVRAVDFDRDQDLDLIIGGRITPGAYPTTPRSFMLQNTQGRFQDVTDQVAPGFAQSGMITDIQFADLQGDGQPEIITCGEWMAVRVWGWNGQRFEDQTAQWGLETAKGWWNCLLAADLDGDGDTDLAAGNEGLNSRLRASNKAPLQLWAADFDHNNAIDAVFGHAWNGQYYPVAQRNEMVAQMPVLINKKYQRYGQYAKAGIEDILPEKERKTAVHLQATEMASGWFENRNGQLLFHAFPWQAQTAPVHAVLATDVDGDGRMDLLLAGNQFDKEVETGRMDALQGVRLNGREHGFSFAPNQQNSGWVSGQVRQMVLVPWGGKKSLVIGRNNDTPQVLILNQSK
jgi:enediyne biosynthesis protein E4